MKILVMFAAAIVSTILVLPTVAQAAVVSSVFLRPVAQAALLF